MIRSFFCQDIDAHQYIPTPRNQRIECWRFNFAKFFKDMKSKETVAFANIMEPRIGFQLFYKTI